MNNSFFASLFCITVLTFAPACYKRQEKVTTTKEEANPVVTSQDTIVETETTTDELNNSIVKF